MNTDERTEMEQRHAGEIEGKDAELSEARRVACKRLDEYVKLISAKDAEISKAWSEFRALSERGGAALVAKDAEIEQLKALVERLRKECECSEAGYASLRYQLASEKQAREAAEAEVAARVKQNVTQIRIHEANTREWRKALDEEKAARKAVEREVREAQARLAVLEKPTRISAKTLYTRLVAVILQEWGRRWPMAEYIDPENAVVSLAADAARSASPETSGDGDVRGEGGKDAE
jgi:chromosome segregation ATPase